MRRELEQELQRVRERFDRILDEWVHDEELREAWRAHLHTHAPAPAGPPGIEPLVFRRESDAGSVAEVHGSGDELEVWVDGALLERVAAEKDLQSRQPGLAFSVDEFEFRETRALDRRATSMLYTRTTIHRGRPRYDQR